MIQLYKPNQKGTGHAMSINVVDGSFLFQILKQSGPMSAKGSFTNSRGKPNLEVFLKINETEACNIINAFISQNQWSTIHKHNNKTTSIKFGPYYQNENLAGFSLGVSILPATQGAQPLNFSVPLSVADALLIKYVLEQGIRIILSERYDEQIQKRAAWKAKQQHAQPPDNQQDASMDNSSQPDFSTVDQTNNQDFFNSEPNFLDNTSGISGYGQ